MLEWAKAIHEAIGIESPFIGWIVDAGYRAKLREGSAHTATTLPTAEVPVVKPQQGTRQPTVEKSAGVKKKTNPLMNDRSVKIGERAEVSNTVISTGDNAKIEQYVRPPSPVALTSDQQHKVAAILAPNEGQVIEVVCVGRGCQTMTSMIPAFKAAHWIVQAQSIGIYGGVGSPVDFSTGVHVMENGAPESSIRSLKRALGAIPINFEDAPWTAFTSMGALRPNLCLVIGNPE